MQPDHDCGANMIATLLLAAGQSSRMGARDKLLEPIADGAILTVLARRALTLGPCFVTLPAMDHPRRAKVPDAAIVVVVADANLGMSYSLRAGIAALPPDISGAMILPADMPDITADDLAAIRTRALETGAKIVRATTEDGKPGHPIYFAASQFARFETLAGDRGAFGLCAGLEDQTQLVALKGQRARLDLDTPADWDAYRAR